MERFDQFEKQWMRWLQFSLFAAILILTLGCIIFIHLLNENQRGVVFVGFASLYAIMLLAMYTTYLKVGLVQPEKKKFPTHLIYVFIGLVVFGLLHELGESYPKIAFLALAGVAVVVGAIQFALGFRAFRRAQPQNEQAQDDMNYKRSTFINSSAWAGIALVGFVGISIRFALL